jgi:hypothetical protein
MTTEYRIGNTGSETGNYTDSANGIVAFGCHPGQGSHEACSMHDTSAPFPVDSTVDSSEQYFG